MADGGLRPAPRAGPPGRVTRDPHRLIARRRPRRRGHAAARLVRRRVPTPRPLHVSAHAPLTCAIDGSGRMEQVGFRSGDGEIDLLAVDTAWWRRPQPFELDHEIATDAYRVFVQEECYEAVAGTWLTLDAFWINDPAADDAASRKLNQLRAASESGLEIPPTCVTSDPAAAARFIERAGADSVVYKSFSAHEHAWRETRLLRRDEPRSARSRSLRARHLPGVRPGGGRPPRDDHGLALFRHRDPDGADSLSLRLPDGPRAGRRGAVRPGGVEEQLFVLLRRLRLVYGAIDLRLRPTVATSFSRSILRPVALHRRPHRTAADGHLRPAPVESGPPRARARADDGRVTAG